MVLVARPPASLMAKGSSSRTGFLLRVTLEVCLLSYVLFYYSKIVQQQGQKAKPLASTSPGDAAVASLRRELAALTAANAQLKEAQSQQAQHAVSQCSTGVAVDHYALLALQAAGTACHAVQDVEYWGEPVVWGGSHRTGSAAECCAACHAYRHAEARGGLEHGHNSSVCNTWVWCGDEKKCGQKYQECWLKVLKDLPALPAQPSTGTSPGWTSGAVYPAEQEEVAQTGPGPRVAAANNPKDGGTLVLRTAMGNISMVLRPDLAPGSVRELRRMVRMLDMRGGHCSGCHFYRSEQNFLLQGVVIHPGAYVAQPRNPNPPQQSVMERGLACWAGGAGGPDLFINLIDQSGFGDSHLCFGKITDMSLVDKIMTLPLKPKAKPNDMTFLQDFIYWNVTLVD